jgi:hypothetical protein
MQRFMVIECSTEYNSVWVYEVQREFTSNQADKGVTYYRSPSDSSLFFDPIDPKFYGKLDAVLISRQKIDEAQPIEPETMVERVERISVLADMNHAGISDMVPEEPLL